MKLRKKNFIVKILIDFNINPGTIKYILPDNNDENILWFGGIRYRVN